MVNLANLHVQKEVDKVRKAFLHVDDMEYRGQWFLE
jgi:hypothetical protein